MVDEAIIGILRQRMMECSLYYGQDKAFKCKKETDDLLRAETNMFAKCESLNIAAAIATSTRSYSKGACTSRFHSYVCVCYRW